MALFDSNFWGVGGGYGGPRSAYGMASNAYRPVYDTTDWASRGAFGIGDTTEDEQTRQNVNLALQAAARQAYGNSAYDNWLAKVGLSRNMQNFMQQLAADPTTKYAAFTANQDLATPWWMASPQEAGRNTMYNRVRWSGY